MKRHASNYYNTFIAVAEDCPVFTAIEPPLKEPRTAASIAYDMLYGHPYRYTADDVIYASNGARRGIPREEFFAKAQPCLRASALGKRYGWGVHCDGDGRIAIVAVESGDYQRLAADESLSHMRAMRSGKGK